MPKPSRKPRKRGPTRSPNPQSKGRAELERYWFELKAALNNPFAGQNVLVAERLRQLQRLTGARFEDLAARLEVSPALLRQFTESAERSGLSLRDARHNFAPVEEKLSRKPRTRVTLRVLESEISALKTAVELLREKGDLKGAEALEREIAQKRRRIGEFFFRA